MGFVDDPAEVVLANLACDCPRDVHHGDDYDVVVISPRPSCRAHAEVT